MTSLLPWLLVAVTTPTEVTATLLEGPPVRGALTDWDGTVAHLRAQGQSIELPAERLLALRWEDRSHPRARLETYVELIDGSRLPLAMAGELIGTEATGQFLVTERVATLIPAGAAGTLSLPTQLLSVVQLMPEAAGADTLWREVRAKQLAGDVLVVRKRKGQALDYLTGVVGDLTDSHLVFQWDGETIPVKRSKVAALAYYHPQGKAEGAAGQVPLCRLVTSRGAVLMVARLSLQEDRLNVKTASGVSLELPVEELVSADYSFGKLVYLSDLKPLSVQWVPSIGLPSAATAIRRYGDPRYDASYSPPDSELPDQGRKGTGLAGDAYPLTLRWQSASDPRKDALKTYAKGLAIRSRTELVFRLPKGMRHFHAIAGIDPATSSQGNVEMKIAGDRGGLWEGAVDGNQRPVEIELDLQDSSRLTILVDYGKNLDWGDRLHLVDARVTR